MDQLTTIVRLVNKKGLANERFLQFFENSGHKSIEMKNVVIDLLKRKTICVQDCRGQSYDNAKNMSGRYKGLQKRIQDESPLALLVPCNNHSLCLSILHSAETSSAVVQFFMFIQNVYIFFRHRQTGGKILKIISRMSRPKEIKWHALGCEIFSLSSSKSGIWVICEGIDRHFWGQGWKKGWFRWSFS